MFLSLNFYLHPVPAGSLSLFPLESIPFHIAPVQHICVLLHDFNFLKAFSTSTLRLRTSSALKETGGSMAMRHNSCRM